MATTRYLLGRGELLTEPVDAPRRGGKKKAVYSFPEAVEAIVPGIKSASQYFDELPAAVCPKDLAVAKLTINPAYIAKSYFPERFLRMAELYSIGSRTDRLVPRKWAKKGRPVECSTTTVFVAGERSAFRRLPTLIETFEPDATEALQFAETEAFTPFKAHEKIRSNPDRLSDVFEVGMQLLPGPNGQELVANFVEYVATLGGEVDVSLHFPVNNLWFAPVQISRDKVEQVAAFNFVRVIRPMPKLRGLRPLVRGPGVAIAANLPDIDALSSEPRVAVLDGGLPDTHSLGRWVKRYEEMDPREKSLEDGEQHGLGVLSALLFGPLKVGETAARPYSNVTCYRVLDRKSDREDPYELYRTLGFVENVLLSRQYQFLNLSLGPDIPIEDTDVHAWTSVIDTILEDGETLLTVAAGNNGERDRTSGNARIQPPSDCVNGLSVGACGSLDSKGWNRAPYSAIGPGRSPGIIKPDLVAFGGSAETYFHHISPGAKPAIVPNLGTSFAAPALLRVAVGVRSILGPDITPLGIKALLVHCADRNGHPATEVGWGRISDSLVDIIDCPNGRVRIVYQGELLPGKYRRAHVPVPQDGINGKIKMKATFCYACPVEPQEAAAYTCAGLEITFRPDLKKKARNSNMPKPRTFFSMAEYATEDERRSDYGKWETVLHGEDSMLGRTLRNPVFDIHYNAREGGSGARDAGPIKYALVITIDAPKHETIYEDILNVYSEILVPLQPQVQLPIRT